MKQNVYIALTEEDAEFLPVYRAEISRFAEVNQNLEGRRPTDEEKAVALAHANIAMIGRSGGRLTPELIDGAKELKAVGVVGGAVRMSEPEYLIEKGIILFNAGWAMSESVAEFTVAMMLSGLRDIPYMIAVMHEKGWGKARSPLDLGGRRVGLVGFGGIGKRVAELLAPFRCDITAYDPHADFGNTDVRQVELSELLKRSEVVSIHAGMTDETRGMLGTAELALMPDRALLVNTARAGIVDEEAVISALGTGRIRAALNVFWKEPLAEDHPLRSMDNVILTPHGGGLTYDRQVRQSRSLVDDIKLVCEGKRPVHEVTSEMLLLMT